VNQPGTGRSGEAARVAVVVPIRSFRAGKGRLAGVLSDHERAALARSMAGKVLDAAGVLPVYVVSSDEEVVAFASDRGAKVVPDAGSLNAAADAGRAAVAAEGFDRLIVIHADLAEPTPFAWVADFDGVTIVPDRHGGGTNVLALPARAAFEFAYGDGSRTRHEREANARGLALRVVADASLGWDVDEPADLRD
jgi:2-phospho-L-lactate/phosphoenolpyruvate guanylyltransferase